MTNQSTQLTISLSSDDRQLLSEYKQEAFAALADAETAKNHLKDIIETAADSLNLDKKLVRKYFTQMYQSKIKDTLEEAEQLAFLMNDSSEEDAI